MILYFKTLISSFSLVALLLLAHGVWAKGIYMTADQFLQQSFPTTEPENRVIWLNAGLKEQISKFLYRPYKGLRVRYWQQDGRSAWIFDEIGKEMPISIGLLLNEQQIESVTILAFRESRGSEVRYPFFTDQFRGASLTKKHRLNQNIDGITGATLSVKAVTRAVKLALFLNNEAINQQALKQQAAE